MIPSGPLPTVSVIIPVHDDPDGIRQCLAAIGAQDYPPDRVQVLVCDNASTVPIGDVSGVLGSGADLHVLQEPVPGSYRARNACLPSADGEVLVFTDADCTPDSAWLREGVRAVLAGADLVAGRVSVYSMGSPPSAIEVHEMVSAFPQDKYVAVMGFGVTANLFVRRGVVDAIGPFADALTSGGDREFCNRATTAGFSLDYCGLAVVGHPARATISEVWTKARRVRRGTYAERGLTLPLRVWLRRLVPPFGALRRSRDERVPAGARGRYVLGEVITQYLGAAADVPHLLRRQR